MDTKDESKRNEDLLICIYAHFNIEIPLMIKNGNTQISQDEKNNTIIEAYEHLKKQGRLKHKY
jgi:hypothetical protein